jgi:3-carboxy-cis,cis-muconate cycloisomerase
MSVLLRYAAGSVAACLRLMGGLEVSVPRMRANLEIGGGLVMAEAAMLIIAAERGRHDAHSIVHSACEIARASDITLQAALEETLDQPTYRTLVSADVFNPNGYLGEAGAIVDRAVKAWRSNASSSVVQNERGGQHGQ